MLFSSSPSMRTPRETPVELPKLRIPIETTRQQQETGHGYNHAQMTPAVRCHLVPPVFVKTEAAMQSQYGPITLSPSSPSSFFTQPEMAKLGLTPLLEAAEQARSSTAEASTPLFRHSSSRKREQLLTQTLPPMHTMGGYPLDTPVMAKRARVDSDVGLDVQASYNLLGHMPRQAMVYPSVPQQQPQQQLCYPDLNKQRASTHTPATELQSLGRTKLESSHAHGLSPYSSASIWKYVLATGEFPSDIGLSENGSGGGTSPATPFDPHKNQCSSESIIALGFGSEVRKARWSADEEDYATAPVPSVKKEELILSPHVSMQKFASGNLKCKTMRVTKKSLSPAPSPRGQEGKYVCSRDEPFNPLSLKSIMNYESRASPSPGVFDVADTTTNSDLIRQSPSSKNVVAVKKLTQRIVKRSDYSQHGRVRSGRWSVEEENYAKAMIEAFKTGCLPLHGNVSLRKFLSEVLVCHPMRISKKFVGYVRKYHWYRIAAGKCDPEAKRQALHQLSHLERVFWTSLQLNSDWSSGLRQHE